MLLCVLMAALKAEATNPQTSKECQPIIEACVDVIQAADKHIKALEYKGDLQSQLIVEQERRSQELQGKLDKANVWYKQPEFVAPTAAFLTITIIALLRK